MLGKVSLRQLFIIAASVLIIKILASLIYNIP